MQVELDSRDLTAELYRLSHVWESKPRLPKDSFLHMSHHGATPGFLRLSIFSPIMEAHTLVKACVSGAGAYATPLAVIMPLSKLLPSEGKARFTFKEGKAHLKIATGSYQLSLANDMSIFPDVRPEEWDVHKLHIQPFLHALKHASTCLVDTGKTYSNLVYVDKCDFAATDSYRLVVSPNEAFSPAKPLLLTGDFVDKTLRLLVHSSGECGVGSDESSLYIKRGGLSISGRLSSRTFPGFRSALPKSDPVRVKLTPQPLMQALRRLVLVGPSKAICPVTLSFEGASVKLEVMGSSGQVSLEELACEVPSSGRICVNAHYLLSALAVFAETGDSIILEYRGAAVALLVTDGATKHVLQPIAS